MHSLTLLLLPVFGAILISVLPGQSPWIRRVAIATTVLVMFYAASFFFVFGLAGMGGAWHQWLYCRKPDFDQCA